MPQQIQIEVPPGSGNASVAPPVRDVQLQHASKVSEVAVRFTEDSSYATDVTAHLAGTCLIPTDGTASIAADPVQVPSRSVTVTCQLQLISRDAPVSGVHVVKPGCTEKHRRGGLAPSYMKDAHMSEKIVPFLPVLVHYRRSLQCEINNLYCIHHQTPPPHPMHLY